MSLTKVTHSMISNGVVDVTDFGADPTGGNDSSTAIQAAITKAASTGATVGFPYGSYTCATPIVNATTLTSGLRFVAMGSTLGLTGSTGTVITYTGAECLFSIQEALGTSEVGNWSWEGFTFVATNPAALAIFRFNNSLIPPTDSASSQNYIRQVAFRNCKFNGPNYTGAVSGVVANAIEATKTFELSTDSRCEFRGWLTGVFLYGCDNSAIQGRFMTNVQHIHLESINTFCNDNTILPSFFGLLHATSGVTDSYAIYDGGSHTTIYSPEFETGTNLAVATIFFGGDGSAVFNPQYGGEAHPLFQLGTSARYVNMYSPCSTVIVNRTPLYGVANSMDTRGSGVWGITVHSPNAQIQAALTPDYRLKVVDECKQWETTCTYMEGINIAPSNNGISARRGVCSALNYIGNSIDQLLPPPSIVSDAGGHFGKSIQTQAANTSGFSFFLLPYKHFMPSDYMKLTIVYRYPAGLGAGNYQLQTLKSDATGIDSLSIPYSLTYTTLSQTVSLAGFTSSDYLRIKFYNNGADAACNVAAIFWEIVQPAIPNTSGATVAALETEVNLLKDALRLSGVIGG